MDAANYWEEKWKEAADRIAHLESLCREVVEAEAKLESAHLDSDWYAAHKKLKKAIDKLRGEALTATLETAEQEQNQ